MDQRDHEAIGIAFTIVGVLMTCGSIALLVWRIAFLFSAERGEGVVIEGGDGPFHAHVEFTTTSGQRLTFREDGIAWHDVGDRVQVLYLPQEPSEHPCVDHPLDLFGWNAFAFSFAFSFLAVGLGLRLSGRSSEPIVHSKF